MTLHQKHWAKVQTVVLNGNNRYHVVTNGKIAYTGNNPLKFWFYRLKGKKAKVSTYIKYG